MADQIQKLTAQEALEAKATDLMIRAIEEAESGNTPILSKLLDKLLPNLNRSENLNVNVININNILEEVTKNIGVIESLNYLNSEKLLLPGNSEQN